MDIQTAIELFIGLMIIIVVLGSIAGILVILRDKSKSTLLQRAIDLVMPYVEKGIHSADVLAIATLTNAETTLSGIDKKAIADSWYDLIPNDIHIGRLPVPVKSLVSRAMFEMLVEDAYQQFDVALKTNIAFLTKNLPVIPPSVITPAKSVSLGSNAIGTALRPDVQWPPANNTTLANDTIPNLIIESRPQSNFTTKQPPLPTNTPESGSA